MNENNTIKSRIPQSVIEDIPSEKRGHVAAQMSKFFQEMHSDFHGAIGLADICPLV